MGKEKGNVLNELFLKPVQESSYCRLVSLLNHSHPLDKNDKYTWGRTEAKWLVSLMRLQAKWSVQTGQL